MHFNHTIAIERECQQVHEHPHASDYPSIFRANCLNIEVLFDRRGTPLIARILPTFCRATFSGNYLYQGIPIPAMGH
jgi:hypothetical protein